MHPEQQDVYGDNARAEVAPFLPDGVRSVLEVGCGAGGFGGTLRGRYGDAARLIAVEAVASQAELARSGAFDEVLAGYFPEALDGRGERFDLIVFNDVLEHIVDPWAVLGRVREWLNPGGRVLATIPNIQYAPSLWNAVRGDWSYTDTGILDRTHVRFFTRRTMVDLFERTGFRVLTVDGVNPVWSQEWRGPAHPNWLLRKAISAGRRAFLAWQPDARWLQFVVVGERVG